jgi:fructose 1,6-bisphosphate aldolase/phosphatase
VEKITLTVVKANVGGYIGRTGMHDDVLEKAREHLTKAVSKDLFIDSWTSHIGDDLVLAMTHQGGLESKDVHRTIFDTLVSCSEVAEKLHLFSPGQDLLSRNFGASLRGMGPVLTELVFRERPNETLIIFTADKCDLGAWNYPLYRMFADPFNTPGLIIDPSMHEGFAFEILDLVENKTLTLQCPGDIYDLIMFLGSRGRFVVNKVIRRVDGAVGAIASCHRPPGLGQSAGTDDPVLVVRCQTGLPEVGEALEAFAFPHLVSGWMRATHQGPLMPVSMKDGRSGRFDGPPRVVASAFQLMNGEFIGPVDLFDDPSFDPVRARAMDITEYMRRHGPFEPHRVPHDQMANTPFPPLLARLEDRMVSLDDKKKKRKKDSEDAE